MTRQVKPSHGTSALVLGIIEMVCGIIVIICSIVLASKANFSTSNTPYWAGIVFIIPGIIGIITGCTKSFGVMIAFMVLNIIAFVIQGIGTIFVAIIVVVYAAVISEIGKNCHYNSTFKSCRCEYNNKRDSYTISGVNKCEDLKTIGSLLYAIVVFLVIASIVALAASIIGCVSVCCSGGSQQPGTVIVQQPMQNTYNPPPAYKN